MRKTFSLQICAFVVDWLVQHLLKAFCKTFGTNQGVNLFKNVIYVVSEMTDPFLVLPFLNEPKECVSHYKHTGRRNCFCFLWNWFYPRCLLFWLLLGHGYVMVNPSFVRSYKFTQKVCLSTLGQINHCSEIIIQLSIWVSVWALSHPWPG